MPQGGGEQVWAASVMILGYLERPYDQSVQEVVDPAIVASFAG